LGAQRDELFSIRLNLHGDSLLKTARHTQGATRNNERQNCQHQYLAITVLIDGVLPGIFSVRPAGVDLGNNDDGGDGPSVAAFPPAVPNAANGSSVKGFDLFSRNPGSQGFSVADVTLHFGPTSSVYENSWNFGQNRNGLNSSTAAALSAGGVLGGDHEYEAWTGSTIEDRFYAATVNEVTYSLSVGGTRIVDIAYADLFMRIDYGATSSGSDDAIQAYHAVSGVAMTAGLSGPEFVLADAFINDVANAGGGLQVVIDTVQPAVTGTFSYNSKFGSHFDINGRLVATLGSAVPEPGTYAAWCAVFALGAAGSRRRRTVSSSTAIVD
jgi:hypothetical protein